MPELPEVQTTASILDNKIKGLRILDTWTDYGSSFHIGKSNIKDKNYFSYFKKEIFGKKILGVSRRAKNILIHVSGNRTILVHMKMTGHLLYGKFIFDGKVWQPPHDGLLDDPFNRFIHFAVSLSNGFTLVLSDVRKFAKVTLIHTDMSDTSDDLVHLGYEPLAKNFTYTLFKQRLLLRPKSKIKTALMNQELIVGIGNIYSDEILWFSGIHPLEPVQKISEVGMHALYKNTLTILKKSIMIGGDSASDYRNPLGQKGNYQNMHKAYRRTGKPCLKKGCHGMIKRIKVGGRSAHFCSVHQKLF